MADKEKIYIDPILKVFSTFSEAKEFFDKESGVILFESDEERLRIEDVAQGNRNLVIGEPGVGKTELLKKIQEILEEDYETCFISLKQLTSIQQIDAFLAKKETKPKVLLLDALDEIQSSRFPEVLSKINDLSEKHPEIFLYISSRLVFINKYSNSFPGFRYIVIPPFTVYQVREYLISSGIPEKDIEILLDRVTSFNHHIRVIQIPRYLFFLEEFLKDEGAEAASQISRNDLFEYFIYKKLETEDKLSADKRTVVKRVLEKLALVMEIYQTNSITQDELMSFFDELDSDLKNVVLSQVDLAVFYDNSLLKVSDKSSEEVQFENTEFQEYLAAKELTRFSEPSRAASNVAIDPNIGEIYPSWFNSLSFLVDMLPELLPQLIEFSGVKSTKDFKVVDDGFITFLSRVDPRAIASDSKKQLFLDVFNYYQRTQQWLSGELTELLASLYDPSLESYFKDLVKEAEPKKGSSHFVPLGNIAFILQSILRSDIDIDRDFWLEKLISYAADDNDNGAMQRRALLALEEFSDSELIDKLPNLMESPDKLIREAFLSTCRAIDPNHPKTLEYHIRAVKRDDFQGRYGFFELVTPEAISGFLGALATDEIFRDEFIKDTSIFKDEDKRIINHIEVVFNTEIEELCKQVIVKLSGIERSYSARKSPFMKDLWKLLKKKSPGFISEIVRRILEDTDSNGSIFFVLDFLVEVVEKEDIDSVIEALVKAGKKDDALSLMFRIASSGKKDATAIFEAGRSKLPAEYQEWEKARLNAQNDDTKRKKKDNEDLLKEFRSLLEPEPGKYSHNVFRYYLENVDQLSSLMEETDKERLIKLVYGSIFEVIDPSKFEVRIKDGEAVGDSRVYTITQAVHLFGDALEVAILLGLDISKYRQKIIDYIPFADSDQLGLIFEKFKDIEFQEMSSVVDVYSKRDSDVWRHQVTNFIDISKRFNLVQAVPVLRGFVRESKLRSYEREQSLVTADLISSDPAFLKDLSREYEKNVDGAEKSLVAIADGLLITKYSDAEAVKQRIQKVVEGVAPFNEEEGAHYVGDLEDEISYGKRFAKPLMELKDPSFTQEYLQLLDDGVRIWGQGKEFHAYAGYIWDIVYAYFDNLKEHGTYDPLNALEKKVAEVRFKDGANWLARRTAQIRRAYLGYVGKPKNISEGVAKYNESKKITNKKIQTSNDLFRQIQGVLEEDLTRWIEGEGAYQILIDKAKEKTPGKKKQYEKLVHKTIKSELENALTKRGFQVDVARESQLLDDKRTDLIVRYGFVGPIIIEVKLTSNSDIRRLDLKKSKSYESMVRYMSGYGASHGIFLVIDDAGVQKKKIEALKATFEKIKNVWVKSFKCHELAQKKTIKKTHRKT